MAIPDERPSPAWVESRATEIRGLDLLGLRAPAQNLSLGLLDGITTVTPRIRYIALRAWIAKSYVDARLPNEPRAFDAFSSRIETAIALGNVVADRAVTGVVGANEAAARVDSEDQDLSLDRLVHQPAVSLYAGASEDLGVTFESESGIPGLTEERGLPLAESVAQTLSSSSFLTELAQGEDVASVARSDLGSVAALVSVGEIPPEEGSRLRKVLLPSEPRPQELPRIASYSLLMWIADREGRIPADQDVFAAAASRNRAAPAELHSVLDGWLQYAVRDMLAVAHEAVLGEIISSLAQVQPESAPSVAASEVVSPLIAQVEDHADALLALGLIAQGESPLKLPMPSLAEKVSARCAQDRICESGLYRWEGDLDETKVIRLMGRSGPGALALAVVAWLLAAERASGCEATSRGGWSRMGLQQVIEPALARFRNDGLSLASVMAEVAYRTADQHLQVAWARMATDATRDVALMASDGQRWSRRDRPFRGGQTASRISQAVGWLTQLRLIDATGLTAEGEHQLEQNLRALSVVS